MEASRERESPEHDSGAESRPGHVGMRRAGVGTALVFILIPPFGGAFAASLLLASSAMVPWVLIGGLFGTVGLFLVATPLGRRSNDLRVTFYRRLTELSILAGMTSAVVVAYTLLVYLLIGWQRPWAKEILSALVGG